MSDGHARSASAPRIADRMMRFEPDDWLAALFGHPVYRVTGQPDAIRTQEWETMLRSSGPMFAYTRIDANAVAAAHILAEDGFRVVDVTLKMGRAPSNEATVMPCRVDVRSALPADYDRVVEIAGSAFRYSRFHLDPLVPRRLANEIKRAWMESYRRGARGAGCMVATLDGVVAGFLAVVKAPGQQSALVIDLIAVDPSAQGRGIGRALVQTFTNNALGHAEKVEVCTQSANVPSMRLYENCGYRLLSTAYVLHGHFGGRENTE